MTGVLAAKVNTLDEVNSGDAAEFSFPPRLGEHNDLIYGKVLGYNRDQLVGLRSRRVI